MPSRTSAATSARSATRSARLMVAVSPRSSEERPELIAVDNVAVFLGVSELARHHLHRHADGQIDAVGVGELAGDQRPLLEPHHTDRVRRHGGEPARRLQDAAEGVERAAAAEREHPETRGPARRADRARREVAARAGGAGASLQPVVRAAQTVIAGQLHGHTCRMWVTATEPEPPTLWAMPTLAPRTCAGPASPRSCSTVSTSWEA